MTTYKKIRHDEDGVTYECAVEYAFKAGALGGASGDATHPIYIDTAGTPQVCTGISATQADTLTPGRTIRTDLASETATLFDGSANITPGVTGVLPVAHGGTGNSTVDTTPTADSTKMVTSGGVQAQIAAEASSRVSDIANLVGQIATEKTTRQDADNQLSARIDGVINGTTPPTTISGVLPVANGGTGNSSVDTTPTSGSTRMCTSGGIKSALDGKMEAFELDPNAPQGYFRINNFLIQWGKVSCTKGTSYYTVQTIQFAMEPNTILSIQDSNNQNLWGVVVQLVNNRLNSFNFRVGDIPQNGGLPHNGVKVQWIRIGYQTGS